MRTDEFLRGYDSCRSNLQDILVKNPKLLENEELMKIAQYPFYKEGGKNWHPDCGNCDYRDLSLLGWYCIKNIKIEDIKEHCSEKMRLKSE